MSITNWPCLARAELKEDARPPLQWDPGLAAEAEAYAKVLAKHDKNLVHAKQNKHGENLFCGVGDGIHIYEFSLAMAVRSWIDERKNYKGQRIGDRSREGQIGHYTQVDNPVSSAATVANESVKIIWPPCTHVGMGKAMSATKKFYIVARYNAMQTYGQVPYNLRKGNIFKNREWQELQGHEVPARVRLDRMTIKKGEKLPPSYVIVGKKEPAKKEERKDEKNDRKGKGGLWGLIWR